MKPVLLGLIIVVLLLLAVMPGLVSSNIQDSAASNLYALFPPETQDQIEIQELEFERGWFDSEALYNIEYTTFGSAAAIEMQLRFQFKHGPLLVTNNGPRLGLAYAEIEPSFNDPQLTQALLDIPFDLPELDMSLLIGLGQSLNLGLAISAFEISDESATVSFAGLDANLAIASDNSAEFNLNMGRLNARSIINGTGISLDSLEIGSETAAINNLLATSAAVAEIKNIESSGPLPFRSGLIAANSRIQNDNVDAIDVFQELAISEIESDFPIEDFTWTMELDELQTSVIQQYYEVLNEMQQQLSNSASNGEFDSDLLRDMLDELVLILLQNELVLSNEIAANAYEGDHRLDIEIHWLGLPQLAAYEELTLAAVIEALELRVAMSLSLDAVLRSPASEMIDPYAQQGYIALDGDRIELQLSLADNQLVLNGEASSLDQFFPTSPQ